jgi:hypothetical protein
LQSYLGQKREALSAEREKLASLRISWESSRGRNLHSLRILNG